MINIRPINATDKLEWRKLWTSYLTFYNTSVPEVVYDSTFARLLEDGLFEPNALLAFSGTEAVGLVHYIQHRHCWKLENVCYLQDLYVVPKLRGTGVGRALIEAVYAEADRLDLGAVYWLTAEDNATARLLYDRTAQKTSFIKYQR